MTHEQLLAKLAELEAVNAQLTSELAHKDKKIRGLNHTVEILRYDLDNSETELFNLSTEHANLRKHLGLQPRVADHIDV